MKPNFLNTIFLHRTVWENQEIPKIYNKCIGKLLTQWIPTSAVLVAKNFNENMITYNFNELRIQISLTFSSQRIVLELCHPTGKVWSLWGKVQFNPRHSGKKECSELGRQCMGMFCLLPTKSPPIGWDFTTGFLHLHLIPHHTLLLTSFNLLNCKFLKPVTSLH